MNWERCISHSLKKTGLMLLSENLCNWEAEKLFERDYLRKPIFLGLIVNHFKLHKNNMITPKKYQSISYVLCYEVSFLKFSFLQVFNGSKLYTKILPSFSSIQSNNKVSFKTFASFSHAKIEPQARIYYLSIM